MKEHTWKVPEVERGECTATQAAALGLPYVNELGQTIAECVIAESNQQCQEGYSNPLNCVCEFDEMTEFWGANK